MNELETVLAARITRLEKTLVALIAVLRNRRVLIPGVAEELGEILKSVDDESAFINND